MKRIPLTKGFEALVDDEDFDHLNLLSWHTNVGGKNPYAITAKRINKKSKKFKMHRMLLNVTDPTQLVDHINGDTLDNRKENLRVTTYLGNSQNCKKTTRKTHSKYKGVTWSKKKSKWQASIRTDNKLKWLGYFNIELDAAFAYNEAALKYHGEFACLNELLS